MAKARLRRGIEMVKLANRIEALKMGEEDDSSDIPSSAGDAAVSAQGAAGGEAPRPGAGARRLSRAARSAIFREVVLAKVREMKDTEKVDETKRSMSENKKY